ncbi:MAG: glyoxylate reductase [Polyangiales bacterium]
MSARARVLVTARLVGGRVAALAREHDVDACDAAEGLDQDALHARIVDKSGVITLLTHQVDAALLDAAPLLRVVANHAVGLDNVDLDACRARGVIVTHTPRVLTQATADLAFGLILDASRRISEGDRLTRRDGVVARWAPTFLLGRRVHGATLGIVGFGRIGRAVARRAGGFGMRVLYTSRSRASLEVETALRATHCPLDALLAGSDVVSLHAPLDASTRGLLSGERLRRMRRGAVLVNTARGALVDEAALAELLHDGHLAGAGLDVYEREPAIHPRLLDAPGVVLAPHVGSADFDARDAMAKLACESVADVLAGRAPLHRAS